MAQKFMVGIAREKVTPPLGTLLYGYSVKRPAQRVHDDLYATAFVFKEGDISAVMITADICVLETDEAEIIQEMISKETGIKKEHVTFSATHTHSGPSTRFSAGWGVKNVEYIETILRPQVLLAVKRALADMHEAVVGVGTTMSEVGVNRRERRLDGSIHLGQNPWGIFNKEMTFIHFKDVDGTPIGSMIHYGTHGTAAGRSLDITRDWPGMMCDAVERETGAIAAFIAGPSGDTGPRLPNGGTTGDMQDVEYIGAVAGVDAVRAFRSIREYRVPALSVKTGVVSIPYQPLMPLEETKTRLAALGDPKDYDGPKYKEATKYGWVLEVYEKDLPRKTHFTQNQTIISLGNIAFVPFPFEVFSEIALRIAQASPYAHTLTLNNTNGSGAYFPTKSEMALGGYEVDMFGFFATYSMVPDADTFAVNENLRLLCELYEEK